MVDTVYEGLVGPPTGGFIPPGMPGHSPGIGHPYDPERARKLLAEAGYPAGKGFPSVEALAFRGCLLQGYEEAQWRDQLGLDVTFEFVPHDSYSDLLDDERAHIFIAGWTAYIPDPDCFLRASGFQLLTHWHHERYEATVERARRIMDQKERIELYRRADRILIDEAPIIPVGYGVDNRLVKPWVRNLSVTPYAGLFSALEEIIIEPH
jgi:oligopeptide transport system substrate-binding protein